MIRIDQSETIEGLTVYPDADSDIMFYVLPNTPTFRLDNGVPVFLFMKYKFPIERAAGKKGGGLAFFDVEFVVPEDKMKKVKEFLQERINRAYAQRGQQPPPVQIGKLTFTRGKASINLENLSNVMVEKVWNPASPALYGNYITPFTVEFTPEGATLFETALKGKGGAVQVAYELYTFARLPPIKVTGFWSQHKFYQFYQKIDVDWSFWGDDNYQETMTETFHNDEFYQLDFDWGAVTDEKVKSQIRQATQRSFDDSIARNLMKDVAPVSDENRKLPDGIEHVTRNMIQDKSASVTLNYSENQAIEWSPNPRGTLPNITSYPGVKVEDHFKLVDLDDPFFKTINVTVMVNADFERLPIHSVEVHLEYNQGNTHTIEEPIFKSANDIGKFASFIENKILKYKYWYQVNYKGEAQTFKSQEIETDEESLVINVDDTGILLIDASAGDIDFDKIKTVQVALQYENIEDQFILDKSTKSHAVTKILFQPVRNQYKYRVKYNMADGRVFQGDWISAQSNQLYINSPFSNTRTITVRSLGDLEKDINTIFADLKYEDAQNQYVVTQNIALSKARPFFDWAFPVVSAGAGKVTYSATIQYKDGTSETVSKEISGNVIEIGKIADILEVQVVFDLLDITKVKLAKVSLSYKDEPNNIDEKKDFLFKAGSTSPMTWTVKLKDKTKNSYQWQAEFFMVDGTKKSIDLKTGSEPTLLLEVPA